MVKVVTDNYAKSGHDLPKFHYYRPDELKLIIAPGSFPALIKTSSRSSSLRERETKTFRALYIFYLLAPKLYYQIQSLIQVNNHDIQQHSTDYRRCWCNWQSRTRCSTGDPRGTLAVILPRPRPYTRRALPLSYEPPELSPNPL